MKNASGGIIGASSYIEPGRVTDRSVSLDVTRESSGVVIVEVWFDDGDETFNATADNPYTTGGFPVRDTAFAPVETEGLRGVTATPTATPVTETTVTDGATTTTGEMDATTGETDTTTPGFTIVIGLVAVLGAAVLAARRR